MWRILQYLADANVSPKSSGYLNLPYELPNDLRLRILGNEEILRMSRTRGFELVTRGFELVTRRFELVTHGFKLATCEFELVTDKAELVTRESELLDLNS